MPRPIVHIVGARPNFMKAAPVVTALRSMGVEQRLVHTGQHYDSAMSDVFFTQLGLPEPDVNLGVGSGSQARQTAALLTGIEEALDELHPSAVVVYGDVNSTLAATLVAAKTGRPVAHVEAGLRSFDMTMPEEVNRRVVDALADLLFVTSPEAIGHLTNEGRPVERIHFVGNSMIDTLLSVLPRLPEAVGAPDGDYAVVTLHRPANVDSADASRRLVQMLDAVAEHIPIVFPVHPRGRATLVEAGLRDRARLRVVGPVGYLEFLALVRGARVVLTDSGGVQEETTSLGVPCLTLRPNTERPITVTHGTNRLVTPESTPQLVAELLRGRTVTPAEHPPLWDGATGPRVARILLAAYGGAGRARC